MAPKQKKPAGRPTAYLGEEHDDAARKHTGNGKGLADLAELFGVARSTIQQWVEVHPGFSAAIKLGRQDRDDRVERALYERAIGYSHDSEKIVTVSDGAMDGSHVERVPIVVQYPPDTAAARLWLMNRRPKDWRDKVQVEVTSGLAERMARARARKNK